MASTRNIFDFWSKIDTLELAVEAAKGGFAASMICASLTGLLAIASYFGFTLIPGFSVLALIDAAIFAGLGFGIYRYSRTCAVLVLLFYLVEQYGNLTRLSAVNGVMIALFIVFFVRSVRGTFAYHRLRADSAAAAPDA